MTVQYAPDVQLLGKCPLCYSTNVTPCRSEKNDFLSHPSPLVRTFDKVWVQLLECEVCSFAFCKEIPSHPDFFPERYSYQYNGEEEQSSDFKDIIIQDIFRLLSTHKKANGKLLDIGCFAGVFLQAALKQGYEVEGIEVNTAMAKHCIQSKLKVFNGKFSDFNGAENSFDVITLIDVLEHLHEPRLMMEKCHRLLKPGGLLLIKVPNYPAQKLKQDIANITGISKSGIFANFAHINQFSKKSLDNACTILGFTNLECMISRSEMWPRTNLKNKIKNLIRKIFYVATLGLYKITGINGAFNIIHVSRKN